MKTRLVKNILGNEITILDSKYGRKDLQKEGFVFVSGYNKKMIKNDEVWTYNDLQKVWVKSN